MAVPRGRCCVVPSVKHSRVYTDAQTRAEYASQCKTIDDVLMTDAWCARGAQAGQRSNMKLCSLSLHTCNSTTHARR